MNKTFTSLSTIAFSCLLSLQAVAGFALDKGVTDTSGVYIKGTIGVLGDDTFAMFGNVYLDHAKQVGNGPMAMVDTHSQLLVAEQSSINHLLIQNPTTVTLIGELSIVNSLTIDKGDFDTRKGTLVLLPNTTLILRKGGALLRNAPISFSLCGCSSSIAMVVCFTGPPTLAEAPYAEDSKHYKTTHFN